MTLYYLYKSHSVLSVTEYKETKYYLKKKKSVLLMLGGRHWFFGTIFLTHETPPLPQSVAQYF